jgi:hypothetical protein
MLKAYGATFIHDDRFLSIISFVTSVSQSLGRIGWEAINDRIGYRISMFICATLLRDWMVTFIAADLLQSKTFFVVWVILIYTTFCGNFALLPVGTSQAFGHAYHGLNYGLVYTSTVIISIIIYFSVI